MSLTPKQALAFSDDLWQALRASLVSDRKPRTIAEAVYFIRQKSGLSAWALARDVISSPAGIARLQGGNSKTTPAILNRLASKAQELGMGNTTSFLQVQAIIRETEIRTKGGRR